MPFKRKILANQKKIFRSTSLFSRYYFFLASTTEIFKLNIRLRKCIVHICNRTIPVAWRGELKREQNDSFKKLSSSRRTSGLLWWNELIVSPYMPNGGQSIDSNYSSNNKSTLNFKADI